MFLQVEMKIFQESTYHLFTFTQSYPDIQFPLDKLSNVSIIIIFAFSFSIIIIKVWRKIGNTKFLVEFDVLVGKEASFHPRQLSRDDSS